MNKNSENPGVGSAFQKAVARQFEQHYDKEFILEMKIAIGQPAKDHKFDIVNPEKHIVIECKRYTWTETGNVPSAKMGFTNEAAFYLSFLPDTYVLTAFLVRLVCVLLRTLSKYSDKL